MKISPNYLFIVKRGVDSSFQVAHIAKAAGHAEANQCEDCLQGQLPLSFLFIWARFLLLFVEHLRRPLAPVGLPLLRHLPWLRRPQSSHITVQPAVRYLQPQVKPVHGHLGQLMAAAALFSIESKQPDNNASNSGDNSYSKSAPSFKINIVFLLFYLNM